MAREPLTREDRLYALDVKQKQAKKEAENFARSGLFPVDIFHRKVRVPVTAVDCLNNGYVYLSKVLQKYSQINPQDIALADLEDLQMKHEKYGDNVDQDMYSDNLNSRRK